jgi:type IX secretion system PorP/SprF family membrane protein
MKKYILILILFISIVELKAQDYHFSQFHSSPLTLNPAMTGFMLGKYRVGANYRNQWGSIKSKYETYSGSFDMNFMKCKWKRDYFGVGVVFAGDKAGDLALRTNHFGFSFAYAKGFGSRVKHSIALGFQGNFYQRGINLSKAIYPDNIDESASINNSFTMLDMGAGILWHAQLGDRFNMYAGLSLAHINQPKNSFLDDKNSRLPMKYSASAGALIELGNKWNLIPSALFQKQGKSIQGLAGSYVQFIIGDDIFSETAVAIGAWGRFSKPVADAFIVGARADIKNVLIGLTYDINVSDLKNASSGRGAFEGSVQYIIPANCQKKGKGLICPKF